MGITLTSETLAALEEYAAGRAITTEGAARRLLVKGLAGETS